MSPITNELLEALEPFSETDSENDYALTNYATGIAAMFQTIDTLAGGNETTPGWAGALNANTAPDYALAWLGQFGGTRAKLGETTAARRARVLDAPGITRGTPAAIAAAAQATLTATKTVRIGERVAGNPYDLLVATRTDETAAPAATEAAIAGALPAGITLSYITSDDLLYQELEGTLTDYADVEATFTDYTALLTNTI